VGEGRLQGEDGQGGGDGGAGIEVSAAERNEAERSSVKVTAC
jgi:hypothetical protein